MRCVPSEAKYSLNIIGFGSLNLAWFLSHKSDSLLFAVNVMSIPVDLRRMIALIVIFAFANLSFVAVTSSWKSAIISSILSIVPWRLSKSFPPITYMTFFVSGVGCHVRISFSKVFTVPPGLQAT